MEWEKNSKQHADELSPLQISKIQTVSAANLILFQHSTTLRIVKSTQTPNAPICKHFPKRKPQIGKIIELKTAPQTTKTLIKSHHN